MHNPRHVDRHGYFRIVYCMPNVTYLSGVEFSIQLSLFFTIVDVRQIYLKRFARDFEFAVTAKLFDIFFSTSLSSVLETFASLIKIRTILRFQNLSRIQLLGKFISRSYNLIDKLLQF